MRIPKVPRPINLQPTQQPRTCHQCSQWRLKTCHRIPEYTHRLTLNNQSSRRWDFEENTRTDPFAARSETILFTSPYNEELLYDLYQVNRTVRLSIMVLVSQWQTENQNSQGRERKLWKSWRQNVTATKIENATLSCHPSLMWSITQASSTSQRYYRMIDTVSIS